MIDGTYKIQMDSPVGAKEGTAVPSSLLARNSQAL